MDPESDGQYVESALLRVIADKLPAMLAYWDANQRCRFANRAYELWFAVKPESMIGRDMATFLGPLYALNKPYIEAALRGEEQQFERDIPDPAGGPVRHSQALYIPDVADGKVRGFIVLVVDISHRKRAEDALREMERQLQMSRRLAAMATLAAGIAHEINNPLAALLGNLDLVLEDTPARAPHAAPLAEARASARRIGDIVQSMKLLARSDTSERERVDINDTLQQSARLAANTIKYRASLVFELGEVPAVIGSAAQLAQVFLNLLVNAAQAFPEERAARDEIRIATRREGDEVVIEISDTGVGIPEDIQARIFEPFFTTKGLGRGMGLGLSISNGIVTAHGGTLSVRSEAGAGSTFRITLPATTEVAPSKRAAPQPPPVANAARLRLLVVDDDSIVSSMLQRLLAPDHDVTVLGNGRDAIAALAVDDPPFDLILCDLMMPGVTGAQVFETVTRDRPALAAKFVVMTGGAFTPAGRAFLDRAPVPILEKPFRLDQLRALVDARRRR